MASTATFTEFLNSSTSTATPTTLDMGATVASNLAIETYPTSVGNYSLSKCFKISFGGTFTSIYNMRIYKSDGSYVTGESLSYGCSTAYHVPTGGSYQDSIATTVIPTADPGASSPNVTIGGTTSGTITDTENTTDYIYLQSSVTIQSLAGTTNEKTLTFTWTEI